MNITKHFVLLILIFCATQSSVCQSVVEASTYPYSSYYYQDATMEKDDALQAQLNKYILSNKKWKKLISQKRMSVGLVDLRQIDNPRYAGINDQHMMYAASLPKIAVLLAAMDAIEDGCLIYDNDLKKDLRLMIAKSNNAATTRVIERLGYDKIASVMQDDRYKFYDIDKGGGLWVGKKYAKSGHKKPDPLKGLSHAATTQQVCRYYQMLAYGKLVTPEYNTEMMKYLINPEINHKFVNTLSAIAPKAGLFRKSGSWRTYHSDSVLVDGENGRKYILVTLIDDPSGSKICRSLVTQVEKALGVGKYAQPIIKDGDLSPYEILADDGE